MKAIMPFRFPSIPLGLCTLAMLGTAAQAGEVSTISTHAAISDVRYTLIDLDPNDGITPSISFGDLALDGHSRWSFEFQNDINDLSTAGTVTVERPFGSAATTLAVSGISSRASIDQLPSTFEHAFSAQAWSLQAFTLTPHTGLSWTAAASIAKVGGDYWSSSSLWAEGKLFDELADGFDETQRFYSHYQTQGGTSAFRLSGYLSTGAVAQSGSVDLHTETFILNTSPVPEPATCGMLAAGLALLGARLRRTNRQRGSLLSTTA